MAKKSENTKAHPMTYEVVRMPNLRAEAARAARAGEKTVQVQESESQTVELITSGGASPAAQKGGR